jgi:hypothetical protein
MTLEAKPKKWQPTPVERKGADVSCCYLHHHLPPPGSLDWNLLMATLLLFQFSFSPVHLHYVLVLNGAFQCANSGLLEKHGMFEMIKCKPLERRGDIQSSFLTIPTHVMPVKKLRSWYTYTKVSKLELSNTIKSNTPLY